MNDLRGFFDPKQSGFTTEYIAKREQKRLRKKRKREKKTKSGVARSKRSDPFYGSWEWDKLRYEALQKYGPRCMLCGATSAETRVVVDHIKPRRLFPELQLEFSNLQVLCDACNRGKGRTDQTDWRDLREQLLAEETAHMKSIKSE